MRRRLASGGLVVVGVVGAAVLLALGAPGTSLYTGFSSLVAVVGGLLYVDDHRRTAAGFSLVAAALVLGVGRLAIRESVDVLARDSGVP